MNHHETLAHNGITHDPASAIINQLSKFQSSESSRQSSLLSNLNLISSNANLKVLHILNTSKTKSLIDTLHALPISSSNASITATEEDIQLLQCLVLGFGCEVPHEGTTDCAEDGEENVGSVFHAVEHVLGGQADDEVEHPVCGGDEGHTAGALAVGEDFLGQDPGDGTYRDSLLVFWVMFVVVVGKEVTYPRSKQS